MYKISERYFIIPIPKKFKNEKKTPLNIQFSIGKLVIESQLPSKESITYECLCRSYNNLINDLKYHLFLKVCRC